MDIDRNNIKKMLKDLISELDRITVAIMTQKGVKSKSNLIRSVEYKVTNKGIDMIANDYWQYVSSGRRPYTKKVPVKDLIPWIKQYGITPKPGQSINQLAFAIQTSIYKQGINPKGYMNKVMDATSEITEDAVADEMVELITDEVVETLTQ